MNIVEGGTHRRATVWCVYFITHYRHILHTTCVMRGRCVRAAPVRAEARSRRDRARTRVQIFLDTRQQSNTIEIQISINRFTVIGIVCKAFFGRFMVLPISFDQNRMLYYFTRLGYENTKTR